MPRSPIDWAKARAEYEAGDSYPMLAARYGRSHQAISKRGRAEGWVQDAEPAIRRQVAERIAIGKVAAGNPEKREAAIAAAVDVRVGILKKHQDEWVAVRSLIYQGIRDRSSQNPDERASASAKLKDARMAAHALALVQAGERRAHGITTETQPHPEDKRMAFVLMDDPYAE